MFVGPLANGLAEPVQVKPLALKQPSSSRAAAGEVLATPAQVPQDRELCVVWFSGVNGGNRTRLPCFPAEVTGSACHLSLVPAPSIAPRKPGQGSRHHLRSLPTGFNPRAVGEPLCHEGSGTAPVPLLPEHPCPVWANGLVKRCRQVHPTCLGCFVSKRRRWPRWVGAEVLVLVLKVDAAGGVARGGEEPRGWPATIWPGLFAAGTGGQEEEKLSPLWVQRGPAALSRWGVAPSLPTGRKVLLWGWARPAAKQRPKPPSAWHFGAGRGTERAGSPR